MDMVEEEGGERFYAKSQREREIKQYFVKLEKGEKYSKVRSSAFVFLDDCARAP